MNLLKYYIVEVHNITEFDDYPNIIEVDVTTKHYGVLIRTTQFFSKEQWQKAVEQGYFIGE
jgi:hypothetical protein